MCCVLSLLYEALLVCKIFVQSFHCLHPTSPGNARAHQRLCASCLFSRTFSGHSTSTCKASGHTWSLNTFSAGTSDDDDSVKQYQSTSNSIYILWRRSSLPAGSSGSTVALAALRTVRPLAEPPTSGVGSRLPATPFMASVNKPKLLSFLWTPHLLQGMCCFFESSLCFPSSAETMTTMFQSKTDVHTNRKKILISLSCFKTITGETLCCPPFPFFTYSGVFTSSLPEVIYLSIYQSHLRWRKFRMSILKCCLIVLKLFF